MISFEHGFLFVHVPKTAGNSIQNILRDYSEDRIVCVAPHQDGVERFEVRSDRYQVHKHSTLAEYQAQLGQDGLDRLFKFSCVRNPWERAISRYFSPDRGSVEWDPGAFADFLACVEPLQHYVSLPGREQPPACFRNVDFYIRFERLNDDFRRVCDRLGLPFQPLPVRNRSRHGHYQEYYDKRSRKLVARKFAAEIDYFGYAF